MSGTGLLAGIVVLALVLSLTLKKDAPVIAFLLVLAAGVVLLLRLGEAAQSTMQRFSALLARGDLSAELYGPVLRVVGIAVLVRILAALCRDAGQSALAAKVELAGTVLAFGAALRSAVTGEAQPYLAGTDGQDVADSFARLLRNAAPDAKSAWAKAAGSLGTAAGIMILTAAARGFSEAAGGAANDAVDLAGALGISAVLLRDFSGVLSLCRSALDGISVFSATLQPVLAAALSMGGSAVTATTLQVASMFAFDLVLRLIEGLLVPAVCVYLAVTVVDAAAGNGVLRGLAEGIGSLSAGALKLILTLFTAYLAVAGGVSGNVDRVALKTAKFAVSGAVPVVGGVMSDAAETVLSGAVLLRGSVGVFGMICVTAICLAPFVRAGACYLCFKAGAALLAPLCPDSLRRLLSGIGTGFGLLLGMLSAACTILYLELVYAVAMVKPL